MILNRPQVTIVKEGWTSDLLIKFKDKFKDFFKKLKHQLEYNSSANSILVSWAKTGKLSAEESKELKNISVDTLKMVGLSSIALMPIPGGTLLMIFLINSAKQIGIDLIPSKFESTNTKKS